MKLFFNYSPGGFSNCYLLGTDNTDNDENPEAVLVDPGCIDMTLINRIESNNYKLKAVLITHDHKHHVHGLHTLLRIYDVKIFGFNHCIAGYKTIIVRDADKLDINNFHIEVISVPGHSSDSVVYKIEHILFTGDLLCAGLLGSTDSTYSAATQMMSVKKIFTLPGDFTIMPGHGPPSSLEAERHFNAGVQFYEQKKYYRPRWSVDL
ncbi:MAG: MBL fold metallo-hydrolase [Spirochaetaceae bacterium]|nr:MBL fold metallo-hydrolase [Spirochaetaceae bacterium]